QGTLSSVSCPSIKLCFAVGRYETTGTAATHTLVERWNGTAWSIVHSPDSPAGPSALSGISCLAGNNCFAIGYVTDRQYSYLSSTLAERWNGARWSIMSKFASITIGSP